MRVDKLRVLKLYVFIFLCTLFVYFVSGWRNHTRHHFFIPLAEAFLQGRLYVDEMKPELHEMVPEREVRTGIYKKDDVSGKYFVIFPPLPAVILMPFVALWGAATNQSYVSIVLASVSVVAAYAVFRELVHDEKKSITLTLLYAFGSMLWYHAIIGSGWYFSQVCGLLFLWLALLATLKRQSMALIGVLLGLAYLSRYPLLLTFPFFAYMTMDRWWQKRQVRLKPLLLLCVTFGIFVALSMGYNWLRYGKLGHYGYTVLERRPYNITNEYAHGSYSILYAPRVLSAMFLSMPKQNIHFPYLVPNQMSMALWVVFPVIVLVFFASLKERIVFASWLAILLLLPTSLFHGGVGATQFGFRYALDYMPFLLMLIAYAIKDKFVWWQQLLFVLCILINVWGVLFTGR